MKNEFETKKLVLNSILIAIGAILHQITPQIFGIQCDFSLAMLFIIIVLNKDYKTALLSGIAVGIFAALTTKTVNGQIPSLIDKFVASNSIYLLLLPFRNKINDTIQLIFSLISGTLISGSVFIISLSILSGLPTAATTLFLTVVIPTTILNVALGTILYKTIVLSLKKLKLSKL
ncbi:MAG: tryptophan transporter [Clostridiaceae bacterium]|nr:tryptophan transporter [Clostridiaceae bacterium]